MLNIADVTVENLTITGSPASGSGWHLLGNPFPCSLSWNTGWTTSGIGGVAYIWNEAGLSYTPRNPGESIPACNGFMVQVMGDPGDSGSLTIPSLARVHDTQSWFKKSDYPVIRLMARNIDQPSFQESQIRFNPLSTALFDPVFDGRFLPGYAPLFFSWSGGEKLTVNSLPGPEENMIIPFSFEKKTGDHYQIEARITGDLPFAVVLVDKKTGTEHNLTTDPFYDFTADGGDIPERFEITFRPLGIDKLPTVKTWISTSGNNLVIHHQGNTCVEVFSISGKFIVLRNLNGTGTESVAMHVPAGLYLARITTGKNVDVKKVYIHSSIR